MGKGFDFDLVVIGAGIGGFVAAVTASGLGKKVAIVEKRRLGGNCTSFTCIPSKALVRAGRVNRVIEMAHEYGLSFPQGVGVDTRGVMARVRSVVDAAFAKDLPETFEAVGIKVISGRASFLDTHRIDVEGQAVSSQAFIIATGTRPLIPKIPGLEKTPFLTNETLYQLDSLPESILILGGGADGLEYACAFRNLGLDVTVLQRGKRLLPRQDRQMVNLLARHMLERGIALHLGAAPVSCEPNGAGVSLTFKDQTGAHIKVSASALLVTVGRELDVEELALDRVGVSYSPQGILTDETLRTSAPNIYACGDVVGPYQLASTAEYQGILAATNVFLPFKKKLNYRDLVFVLFTDPPLAYVGMNEEEARKEYGGSLRVYTFDYKGMRRAMVDGQEVGAAKFLCDSKGRLVGAHILGEGAPEVIHEAQAVRSLRVPLRRLQVLTHAYPTYAQALVGRASQLAFLDHMEKSLWVRLGLGILPGFKNRLHTARQRLAETHENASYSLTFQTHTTAKGPSLQEVSWKTQQWGGRAILICLPSTMTEPLCLSPPGHAELCPWIVLDFSQVEMMNSLGALSLARLCGEASSRSRSILAVGVAKHHRDALDLTGLAEAIEVCDSWDAVWSRVGFTPREFFLDGKDRAIPQDTEFWAEPIDRFPASPSPEKSTDINILGRRPCGVLGGFGWLWQKTYELRVQGLEWDPEQLMDEFKKNFEQLQAPFNRFHAGPKGIQPGEVVAIHSRTPVGFIATGVMVLYADPVCFSLITPQGHPEAGWMTFRALREGDLPVVQIVGFGRASDPLFEMAYRIMGSRVQVKTWTHVLSAFAEHLGVRADVIVKEELVSRQLRWGAFFNLKHNAQIRTLLPWNMREVRRTWIRSRKQNPDG